MGNSQHENDNAHATGEQGKDEQTYYKLMLEAERCRNESRLIENENIIDLYLQAISVAPSDDAKAEAYCSLGKVYLWLLNDPKQADALCRAMTFTRKHAGCTLLKIDIQEALSPHKNKDSLAKAKTTYNDVFSIIPKDADGYYLRAQAHATSGNYDGALKDYDSAIKKYEERLSALNKNQTIPSTVKADYDYERVCWQIAKSHKYRADIYGEQGNYEEAIKQYSLAITENPKFTAAYNGRGYIHAILSNGKAAEMDFEIALGISTTFVYPYMNLGHLWLSTDVNVTKLEKKLEDLYKNATSNINKILKYDKRFLRSKVYQDYGNVLFELAQKINQNPENSHNNRLKYLYRKAITYCKRSLRINSVTENLDQLLCDKIATVYARLYTINEKTQLSYRLQEFDYQKNAATDSNDPSVYSNNPSFLCNYGYLLFVDKQYSKANEFFTKARELDEGCLARRWNIFIASELVLLDNGNSTNEIQVIGSCYNLMVNVQDLLFHLSQQVPTVIYKYMQEDKINHFRKNRCLWLKPADYQNDPDEGSVLMKYLIQKAKLPKSLNKDIATGGSNHNLWTVFITCFNTKGDNLVMWNSSYSGNGTGIALGIHTTHLTQVSWSPLDYITEPIRRLDSEYPQNVPFEPSSPNYYARPVPLKNMRLARVLYLPVDTSNCRDKKRNSLDKQKIEAIIKILNEIFAWLGKNLHHKEKTLSLLKLILMPIAYLVKSSDYAHEEEWRLFHVSTIAETKRRGRLVINNDQIHLESEKFLFQNGSKEEIILGPNFQKENPDLYSAKCMHKFQYECNANIVVKKSDKHFRGSQKENKNADKLTG